MFTNLIGHGAPWPDVTRYATFGTSGTDGGPGFSWPDVDIGPADPSRIVVMSFNCLNETGQTGKSIQGIGATTASAGSYYHSSGIYGITYLFSAAVPTGTTATCLINFADTVNSWSLVVYSLYNVWPVSPTPYAENSPTNPALGTLVLPLSVQKGGYTLSNSYFNGAAGIYTNYTNQTEIVEYHPYTSRAMSHGYHVVLADDASRDYTFTPVGSGLNIATASVATWRKRPGFVH